MTDFYDNLERAVAAASSESDTLARCRATHNLMTALDEATKNLAAVRRAAVDELVGPGGTMTATALAAELGVSIRRIGQIRTTGPGPERGLLVDTPADVPLTIAVVQKRETERGAPAVAQATVGAVRDLQRMATGLDVDTEVEYVPPPGLIDLNRPHLAVLMGPRVSPLVAQAITADPHIAWRRDDLGHWYLTDAETGEEYRSGFDAGPDDGTRCYAHIGRIRRPDGRGSFLYLGGAHAPGTAGAVRYLVENTTTLWEQVKRSQWSAIVETAVADDGTLTSRLVTPIYLHKR